jgi:hypothetical protein
VNSLEVFRPALTTPGFANLVVILTGWVQTAGPHAVTQALVVTSVAGRRHHERFHRFFSRGTWDPDKLGWWLFQRVLSVFGVDGAFRIAVDDTLTPKKGPKVFGIGYCSYKCGRGACGTCFAGSSVDAALAEEGR